MIDRQIRSLIEYEVIHRKVKNFGRWGQIFNFFAGGQLFVAVTMWYPMKERISSEWFKGSKKYFQIYNTYNTFSADNEAPTLAVQSADHSLLIGQAEPTKHNNEVLNGIKTAKLHNV